MQNFNIFEGYNKFEGKIQGLGDKLLPVEAMTFLFGTNLVRGIGDNL